MKKPDFQLIRRRIRAIPLLLRDKTVPWWKRAIVIFSIVYLFLPIDLIPPVFPLIGFIDDLVLWILLIRFLGDDLDSYDPGDPGANPSEKYRDKTVINVSYDVNDKEEE